VSKNRGLDKDDRAMELKNIKDLIEMMKENDLSELEIVDGQTRVMLKRGSSQAATQVMAMPPMMASSQMGAAPAEVSQGDKASEKPTDKNENLVEIVSPMVGTFFSAPSPNAKPFVEVGSKVNDESVVCIIEAMKVMNEIKSEIKGTIRKILVDNGAAVEYGQPLFLVELN
jgi:acetyl-CoA carboxylase biotin carboxyl carrier protein